MREDLLTELHFPRIEVKCLQKVTHNTEILGSHMQDHECYTKKMEVNFPEFTLSVIDEPLLPVPVNSHLVNRNSLIKKNFTNSSEMGIRSSQESLAADLGWGSNDEEDFKVTESRSCPTRLQLDTESQWEPEVDIDGSFGVESTVYQNSEFLCPETVNGEISEDPKSQRDDSVPKSISCDYLQSKFQAKPIRCYSRRKNKQEAMSSMDDVKSNGKPVESADETVDDKTAEDSEDSQPALCVISEVIGNADSAFSDQDSSHTTDTSGAPLITPKKTNDITKIKGWRRKQFFVEKPTIVEFFSYPSTSCKSNAKRKPSKSESEDEDPGNVENAFVCDSLDEFLDRDAELKITYEIPHLYAEYGIKLTSEDIVSKPELSREDLKEVETKYCVPVKWTDNEDLDFDDNKRGIKRMLEAEEEASKAIRLNDSVRKLVQTNEKTEDLKELTEKLNNMNLTTKLIGLVVYPGPKRPLHPLVQNHLDKIRSYHTKIDEYWASFSVSAIPGKGKFFRRRLLPVYCCGKVEDPVSEEEAFIPAIQGEIPPAEDPLEIKQGEREPNVPVVTDIKSKLRSRKGRNYSKTSDLKKPDVKLKECSVVLERMNVKNFAVWCMDHICYNCFYCGFTIQNCMVQNSQTVTPNSSVKRKKSNDIEIIPSQATFDRTVGNLLAKKLKYFRVNGDTRTSIDSLKYLAPNTVELIKLNFIKQSFMTGYVNIWYLKPETSNVKSRAFLTFTKTSPAPNAINLKSSKTSSRNLPKVITEIISSESTFDSNEYAILHCNGKIWEIHGCMNLALTDLRKNDEKVEQIYTPNYLEETKELQKLSLGILKVKSSKWWILDLNQKFREIQIKLWPFNVSVHRKKFIHFVRANLFGFVSLRKDAKGRILGAYIDKKLLPFVLLGPYYTSESSGLKLNNDVHNVSFKYFGDKNTSQNHHLKYFINSVINEFQKKDKRLEGMWLYDRLCADNTCYVEVIKSTVDQALLRRQNCIKIEHGYSKTENSNPSSSGPVLEVSSSNNIENTEKPSVYLYFEFVELGFVKGELDDDSSVIIKNPFDPKSKVKSYKIGNWFVKMLRSRIQFIPQDLELKWATTRNVQDLGDRKPFNKFILGGAHILCQRGVFFLLDLTESKIEEIGLNKEDVNEAITKCRVLKEVKALKELASLLSKNPLDHLSMGRVLKMALTDIEILQKQEQILTRLKKSLEKKKFKSASRILRILKSPDLSSSKKTSLLKFVLDLFRDENGKVKLEFASCVEKYLLRPEESEKEVEIIEEKIVNKHKISDSVDVYEVQPGDKPIEKAISDEDDDEEVGDDDDKLIEKLESKLLSLYRIIRTNSNCFDNIKGGELVTKLNIISKQLNSFKKLVYAPRKRSNENFKRIPMVSKLCKIPSPPKADFDHTHELADIRPGESLLRAEGNSELTLKVRNFAKENKTTPTKKKYVIIRNLPSNAQNLDSKTVWKPKPYAIITFPTIEKSSELEKKNDLENDVKESSASIEKSNDSGEEPEIEILEEKSARN